MNGSARRLATTVRLEAFLAVAFGILAVVTALWPTWIESITGLDPDAGSGSLEWGIVAVFAVVALGATAIARHDYRSLKAAR
jgi:hypothetical protein